MQIARQLDKFIQTIDFMSKIMLKCYTQSKSAKARAARVRVCNYVKFKPGWNLLPVLKIATCPAHAALHKPLCIVAKHACDQVFYFQYGSIILPGLRASIGVTCSYSSRPFLCALDRVEKATSNRTQEPGVKTKHWNTCSNIH